MKGEKNIQSEQKNGLKWAQNWHKKKPNKKPNKKQLVEKRLTASG